MGYGSSRRATAPQKLATPAASSGRLNSTATDLTASETGGAVPPVVFLVLDVIPGWCHCGVVVIPMTLRLPDELHAALKVEAAAASRSLHAEVLWRLRVAGPASGWVASADAVERALVERGVDADVTAVVGEADRGVSESRAPRSPSVDEHFKPYPKPGGK